LARIGHLCHRRLDPTIMGRPIYASRKALGKSRLEAEILTGRRKPTKLFALSGLCSLTKTGLGNPSIVNVTAAQFATVTDRRSGARILNTLLFEIAASAAPEERSSPLCCIGAAWASRCSCLEAHTLHNQALRGARLSDFTAPRETNCSFCVNSCKEIQKA